MNNLFKNLFLKRYRLPKSEHLEYITKAFSPIERLLFGVFSLLLIWSAGSLLAQTNNLFLTSVPARGGELHEGIVGNPRFINPLLALSDADRDLSALIYSGLLKATPQGQLVPDLAESYTVSEDGLTYTFFLREDASFHDGEPVTADDVLFTIQKAQDSALKSPKRANWEGVTAEKASDIEVRLTLRQPYAPFLENATLGILPKHLWKDAEAEQFPFSLYNIEAVGSGPFRIEKIKRNDSGIPLYFELRAFKDYALGRPYIEKIFIRFYPNEKEIIAALSRGDIESVNAITPQAAKELRESGYSLDRTPLPRIFGVFFNQNQNQIFAEKNVRLALDLAIDKDRIVEHVLEGFGVPIDGPIPPLLLDVNETFSTTTEENLVKANALLDAAKWKLDPDSGLRKKAVGKETRTLTFSLVTSNVPELRATAELLKDMWRKIGVDVQLQVYESGDLNQNVIRPRKYDALLFGEIIGRDLDLFAFWHSSQRNDPGLNIAMYTNTRVDKLLEESRKGGDPLKRVESYRKIIEEVQKDVPAVFLYSPDFIYVIPERIKGAELLRSTIPSERFLAAHTWYINTEKVWQVFAQR